MNKIIPCGNCGTMLYSGDHEDMIEFKGVAYSLTINDNLSAIVEQAFMAGQAAEGVDPSASEASDYRRRVGLSK